MNRDPVPVTEPSLPPPHPQAEPAELQADPAAGLVADEMDVFEPVAPPPERRLGPGVVLLMVAAVALVVLVFTLLK